MEDFDYRLRPAKSIERKMLSEAFSRLFLFANVNEYQYIGFGAMWFHDFNLFHKTVGFEKMVSIERDTNSKQRYEFNRPLNCIKMKFGHSKDILPNLNWNRKTVLWLDYTDILDTQILQDVSLASSQIVSGSLVIITVNVEDKENTKFVKTIPWLKELVGEERVPSYVVKDSNLAGWNFANVCQDIFTNEIENTLAIKNKAISDNDAKLQYKQLFNFRYSDGAKMATFGGIILQGKDSNLLERCAFEQFDFYRSEKEFFFINPPLLTFREIHALEKIVHSDRKEAKKIPIEPDKIDEFIKLHRYFPTFAITEI
jgi:hypothetical protein